MAKKEKVEKSSVDELISSLEKKYGVNRKSPDNIEVVSTGSISLDIATGVGGVAIGKMIELQGQESAGKSTITLHIISEFQKAFPDRRVAYFDFEHSYDKKYANSIGVDSEKLLIYQPSCMEEGYDLLISLVENEAISLAVLDSQTAALPKAVINGEIGDATIGLQARINSKFCGKIKGLLDLHSCTLISISQLRANIGFMQSGDVSTGGNCWKFYSDQRWKIWKLNDKDNSQNKTTVDIIKNKLAEPFSQAKFMIQWGQGIDKLAELVEFAVEFDLIEKGGAGWFTVKGEKLQGMDKVKGFLNDNPEYLEELKTAVVNKLKQ